MRLLRGLTLAGLILSSTALTRQVLLNEALTHPYDAIKDFAKSAASSDAKPDAGVSQSKTIYETLRDSSDFKRLHKAIDFGGDDIAELLDDDEVSLTFFAVPDWVIERVENEHRSEYRNPAFATVPTNVQDKDLYDFTDLAQVITSVEKLERSDDDENEDKEEHKKFLRRLIRAIILYHVLPDELDTYELRKNVTFKTQFSLSDGSLDGKAMRIRASHGFHDLNINFFSKVISENHQTKNGIIHTIDRPLLPPPTIFQELFIAPHFFSYLSTALQRTGLTDELDLYSGENGKVYGATTVTLFAPTNDAFERLPFKLRLFLFSPFGKKVLRKLLEFHIVPDIVLHSDYKHHERESSIIAFDGEVKRSNSKHWIKDIVKAGGLERHWSRLHCERWCRRHEYPHDVASDDDDRCECPGDDDDDDEHHHHREHHVHTVFSHDYTVETLFEKHPLHVHVAQYRIKVDLPGHHDPKLFKTRFLVNGSPVALHDVVSRNGAMHVLDHVLNPVHHHHHHHDGRDNDREDDRESEPRRPHHRGPHHVWKPEVAEVDQGWEGWEEWLIDWANKD